MPTVLVIEDEDAIRAIVLDVLNSCEIECVGAAGLAQLDGVVATFDLSLADLVEQAGRPFDAGEVRDFVQRLRLRFTAPVVLFTAYGPATLGSPAELGALGAISKPFDLDQLAGDVLGFLRSAGEGVNEDQPPYSDP
ncbi:MAG: hypothetical protein NTZ05_11305 [Chloroflexi bacterium]|nr:hypothetical protein [Chloroflexota bacterium]